MFELSADSRTYQRMFKLLLFGAFLSLAAAQFDYRRMMMMQMMQNMGGGAGGGASGGSSNTDRGISNALLCRNTANLVFVPCANYKEVCDYISMQTYNMPNMLKCSALGTGCCIKDMATMMLVRNSAK